MFLLLHYLLFFSVYINLLGVYLIHKICLNVYHLLFLIIPRYFEMHELLQSIQNDFIMYYEKY